MIRLEGVSKVFPGANGPIEAVKNVNLTIETGEIFGIIGFSGAGKSTLLRCINLLERPTSGRVLLDDADITLLSESEVRAVRRRIGMIFQQFNLFASRTVFGNVAFPLAGRGLSREQLKKRVSELLEIVGLSGREEAYPSQLSGGQKQRVAIARALASNPEILLCDEATSALDPQTTRSILQLLRELNRKLGLTIVLITHEMQVIKEICDHVAVMEDGVVVEQGEVFSIFASPQQPVTRNFMEMTSHMAGFRRLMEEKASILELKPGQCILSLRYLERNACSALVSYLSRTYNVDLNIIFGNIEMIGEHPLGGLVVIAEGEASSIESCIQYLKNIHVGVEVLLDARPAR
ncbi:methionine ABC transporter ATP-binding protein [Mailhella massiliensis]|uniref:Cell division ATP-binding protein FtsE n=1 Tax=Mailhella massiliensis TaxID=1903261 RepID=A0A921AWH2_9BACT|nr:ATP-binding cassette domain-containing protein [Mailhella massiliensis]HJD97605.1 ATP-binding cassette domain-containing protein [Mailhella massiliensis]